MENRKTGRSGLGTGQIGALDGEDADDGAGQQHKIGRGIAPGAVGDHAGHRGQKEAADGIAQLELLHQLGDPCLAAKVRRPDRKADCAQRDAEAVEHDGGEHDRRDLRVGQGAEHKAAAEDRAEEPAHAIAAEAVTRRAVDAFADHQSHAEQRHGQRRRMCGHTSGRIQDHEVRRTLMLPGVDGFEICRQIRSQKNTPIIMVSAKKDDIDKIRGLGLGADDYMTKPFSPSELVARVKAHLARYERLIGSNVEQNEVIEIRGLKIDKTARRVWVNGEEKSFTTKEFDLLTFLAGHPNHVYSKEELFREIWDMESIGDIATVTVHIKKIREKIEYDTSHPQYIETIWGVGYRFKV